MSQALYRKYRSRSFDEIVGQKGVVTALQNALKNNAISHAYLFTGPRGVGKTSIARIFAYAINNVAYDTDNLPVDIIEIDAASNRGIDEVRDLRDKVRIAPAIGPYKIYIIDEVHMLTSHAFNALLKTLEEPPAHVVFILATTESHKLPETITSRTQRYNFTLASTDEIVAHLTEICKKENIDATPDALRVIAKHSGGSLRDALSLLDHARHIGTKITAAEIQANIGVPDAELVDTIILAITENDAGKLLSILFSPEASAVSSVALAKTLTDTITANIQQNTSSIPLSTATKLLQQLVEVEGSSQQDTKLQIALLSAIVPQQTAHTMTAPVTISKPVAKVVKDEQVAIQENKQKKVSATEAKQTVKVTDNEPTKELTQEAWLSVLEEIRSTHNTLYSVLRMAQVNLDEAANNKLTLNFTFPFHQKRINEMKNKDVISNTLATLGYGSYEITCGLVDKDSVSIQPTPIRKSVEPEEKDPLLHQIRGVFGSVEVLE